MRGIALYVEGGGDTAETKAALRRGFDALLSTVKQRARAAGWSWRVVPCGSRQEAKDAFLHAKATQAETHAILLVDSETPVSSEPISHLKAQDGWALPAARSEAVHLMAQVMEAWLLADPESLAGFYGQGFRANALPKATNLETVAKTKVIASLQRSTKATQKGRYHKLHHAEPLLGRVSAAKIRSRCPHGDRLLSHLEHVLP